MDRRREARLRREIASRRDHAAAADGEIRYAWGLDLDPQTVVRRATLDASVDLELAVTRDAHPRILRAALYDTDSLRGPGNDIDLPAATQLDGTECGDRHGLSGKRRSGCRESHGEKRNDRTHLSYLLIALHL